MTARPPRPTTAVVGRKVVAEGVPSGLDPRPPTGPRILAQLHICAPGRGATPSARSWCSCGRDLNAFGHRKVTALIADHDRHRTLCPLLPQRKEAA
ncbi:hypothetical protein ACF1CG_05900 [Streptomyces sp. NPDC014773]|uniref:hypothetical protein n=1 Tax=Streptomyces sp. NPDC014773 TaxID=3364908 RepID=UPI0036F9AF11